MAASNTQRASTDTASEAQGRFTVALPKELGAQVDQIGQRIAAAVLAQTGTEVELSRAQIVQSLIKTAIKYGETNGQQPSSD